MLILHIRAKYLSMYTKLLLLILKKKGRREREGKRKSERKKRWKEMESKWEETKRESDKDRSEREREREREERGRRERERERKGEKDMILEFYRRILHGYGIQLLLAFISFPSHSVSTRSSDSLVLSIPYVRSSLGKRTFSVIGPRLCNSLPPDARNSSSLPIFRSRLKTHLFKIAFPP